MAGDIAGNASHGARSMDRIVANTVSTAATADSADTANTVDTEHPNRDRSRNHMPAPEGRGRLGQAKRAVQPPRKDFSSSCPPPQS
jgi:hypothetical protein